MTEQQDPQDKVDPEGNPTSSLGDAYVKLSKSLVNNALGADDLKKISAGFRRASGIDSIRDSLTSQRDEQVKRYREQLHPQWMDAVELPVIEPDTTPSEIAANTERTADLIGQQNAAIAQLVELTINSLSLSKQQQEQSERTEKFSRGMAWASVILTTATVLVSAAALVVALLPRA